MLAAEVVDGAAGIVLALFGIEFNTQDLIRGDHFRGVTKMVSSQLNTARNRTLLQRLNPLNDGFKAEVSALGMFGGVLLQRCDAVAEFEKAGVGGSHFACPAFNVGPLLRRGFVWRGHGVT